MFIGWTCIHHSTVVLFLWLTYTLSSFINNLKSTLYNHIQVLYKTLTQSFFFCWILRGLISIRLNVQWSYEPSVLNIRSNITVRINLEWSSRYLRDNKSSLIFTSLLTNQLLKVQEESREQCWTVLKIIKLNALK